MPTGPCPPQGTKAYHEWMANWNCQRAEEYEANADDLAKAGNAVEASDARKKAAGYRESEIWQRKQANSMP